MTGRFKLHGDLLAREIHRHVPELAGAWLEPLDLLSLERLACRMIYLEDNAVSKILKPVSTGIETGAHENDLNPRRHLAKSPVDFDCSRAQELFHEGGDETEPNLPQIARTPMTQEAVHGPSAVVGQEFRREGIAEAGERLTPIDERAPHCDPASRRACPIGLHDGR